MKASIEIALLFQRYFNERIDRIHRWRDVRASYRSKYFSVELNSSDQKDWEEYLEFESHNPLFIDRVHVDGLRADVVVKQPSRAGGCIEWIYHLSNTKEGWKISKRQLQY